KDQTRFDWLSTMCLDHRQTKEFFLAKAMGWALRQYARTNPHAVQEFVGQHPELPNLTRREALKHLG
ncbi:MAG: DNA alkylation repair protein, partial [Bacteroidota bacterium]